MIILGLILCIIVFALGIALVVTGNDDAFANIAGMVSIILGAVWGSVYFAMLMGW